MECYILSLLVTRKSPMYILSPRAWEQTFVDCATRAPTHGLRRWCGRWGCRRSYLESLMKLVCLFVVVLAGALGMAAGYKLALAREHQRLEKNKELARLVYQMLSVENK